MDKDKIWFRVEIIFYNGQRLGCELENSHLVLLQMKIRNRPYIKEHQNFFFEVDGVFLDTRCIMATQETILDEDNT